MLKISEGKRGEQSITLRLEGRIVGPWVEELQHICDPFVNNGCKLALDLTEISFADESGVTLLSGLKARGVKLLNTAPFVAEQLKSSVSR